MKSFGILVSLIVCGAVGAQADARRFLPENPQVTFEMDGFAALAEGFEATNFGAMCQSDEWDDLWERVEGLVLDGADDVDVDPRADRFREIIEAYAGRMHVGVSIRAVESADSPEVTLVFAWAPDEGTDFEEVVQLATEIATEDPDARSRFVETPAGEVELVTVDEEDGVDFMLPVVLDECLVCAIGMLEHGYLPSLGQVQFDQEAGDSKPISLHVSGRLWRDFGRILDSSEPPDRRSEAMAQTMALIFGGGGDLDVSIAPADSHVVWDVDFRHETDRPTLFTALHTESRPADLLAFAPREHPSVTTFGLRPEVLLEMIDQGAQQFGGDGIAPLEAMLEEETGVRLREDVFAHLDGSGMLVTEMGEFDEDVSLSLTLGLRDAAALETVLEGLLRKRGLHAGRKTKEYRGTKLRMLNLGFFAIHWAFTDSHFVFGFGGSGGEALRRVVDGIQDRKDGEDPPEWSEEVRSRFARIGFDGDWVSVSDMSSSSGTYLDFVRQALAADPMTPDEFAELFGAFAELMADHDLLSTVSATDFSDGRIRMRVVW